MGKQRLIVIMVLVWWGGLMVGDAYERGVEYLLEQVTEDGHVLSGVEGGILLRTLYLQFGHEALEWVDLPGKDVPGERGDLCAFMESMWRQDFLPGEHGSYINDDGGWPVEIGAASECMATVLGVSYLLDAAGGWHEEIIEDAVDYLRKTCCQDGDWSSMEAPPGSGNGGLGGRLEFFVMLTQLFREGLLKDRAQESSVRHFARVLEHELGALGVESSCYEIGLFLRGLCLLGEGERGRRLIDWLAQCQLEDGRWSDARYGSDVTVTCVVLDGLSAACLQEDDVGTEVRWQLVGEDGSCRDVSDAHQGNVLRLENPRSEELASSVTVYDSSGEVVMSYGTGLVRDSFPLWYRQLSPGSHEVVVRRWRRPGLGYCGESRHSLDVPHWVALVGLSVSESGVPRRVSVGGEVELCPEVRVSMRGNGSCSGLIRLHLESSGGEVLLEFGEEAIVYDVGEGVVGVVFSPQGFVFPAGGHYFLVVSARVGASVLEERMLIIAEEERRLEVENWLVPSGMELGRQPGRVHFRLRFLGGQDDGIAHQIGGSSPEELLIGIEEAFHKLRITGIRDSRGRTVKQGVLVLRTYKGRFEGGESLGGGSESGCTMAFPVKDGSCEFQYCPGELWQNYTVSIVVYGAIRAGSRVECLERIGSVEVSLTGSKALQQVWEDRGHEW